MPTSIYSVSVRDGASFVACVVTIYNMGPRFRGADFVVVTSPFDDSQFSIRSGRQATFQEELRVRSKASDIVVGDDQPYIESKMREAYGARVEVEVEPFRLAERAGRSGR